MSNLLASANTDLAKEITHSKEALVTRAFNETTKKNRLKIQP